MKIGFFRVREHTAAREDKSRKPSEKGPERRESLGPENQSPPVRSAGTGASCSSPGGLGGLRGAVAAPSGNQPAARATAKVAAIAAACARAYRRSVIPPPSRPRSTPLRLQRTSRTADATACRRSSTSPSRARPPSWRSGRPRGRPKHIFSSLCSFLKVGVFASPRVPRCPWGASVVDKLLINRKTRKPRCARFSRSAGAVKPLETLVEMDFLGCQNPFIQNDAKLFIYIYYILYII